MVYTSLEELFECLEGTDSLKLNGLDDCIIGLGSRCGQPDLLVYDYEKIVLKLVSEGMEFEEAVEFCDFNIAGAWMGEGTPIILNKIA